MFGRIFRAITRGLGLEPKMPAVAPPPPLPAQGPAVPAGPTAEQAAAMAADAAAEEQRKRAGRSANMLTGGLGVPGGGGVAPRAGGQLLGG
jgi:hypothetical protein